MYMYMILMVIPKGGVIAMGNLFHPTRKQDLKDSYFKIFEFHLITLFLEFECWVSTFNDFGPWLTAGQGVTIIYMKKEVGRVPYFTKFTPRFRRRIRC